VTSSKQSSQSHWRTCSSVTQWCHPGYKRKKVTRML